MTLRELLEVYFDVYARPHCRSWRNMERLSKTYLSQWNERPAAEIKRFDVIALHSKLAAEVSPTTANRWKEVITRAGLQDARIHDLRRSLASWQALTGANLSVIAATLNHKDLKSTAVYARLNTDAVREAMERAINGFS